MEITIVEKGHGERPTFESTGQVVWRGRTDYDLESPLPASLLSPPFDVGTWYSAADFAEQWAANSTEIDAYPTEVGVRLLGPARNVPSPSDRNPARIQIYSIHAAASIVNETLALMRMLDPDLRKLWIRLE